MRELVLALALLVALAPVVACDATAPAEVDLSWSFADVQRMSGGSLCGGFFSRLIRRCRLLLD